jgi:hypothetical protein
VDGPISGTLPKFFNRSSVLMPGRGIFGAVEVVRENSIFSGAAAGGAGAGAESAARKQETAVTPQSMKAIFRKGVLPDLIRLIFIIERRANVKKFSA